jgi:hypothetical protein
MMSQDFVSFFIQAEYITYKLIKIKCQFCYLGRYFLNNSLNNLINKINI